MTESLPDGETSKAPELQLGELEPPKVSPKRAVCLVDYDNVRAVKEKSRADVEQNVLTLRQRIIRAASLVDGGCEEMAVRLYGGWRDHRRRATQNSVWLTEYLTELRGRERRLLFNSDLVFSALCRPSDVLVGTYRPFPAPARQKMVDTLMVIDILHLLREPDTNIIVLSDDDDLIPAVLYGHADITAERPLHWIRRRTPDDGLNDELLNRLRVRLHGEEAP